MPVINEAPPKGKIPVSPQHAAAQMWARAGWRVFPCEPGGKRPIIDAWDTAATEDIAQVDKWWSETPSANPAILPEEECTILDVEPEGVARLAEFQQEHGAIPATFTVQTARGGLHYYLAGATDRRIRSSISQRICKSPLCFARERRFRPMRAVPGGKALSMILSRSDRLSFACGELAQPRGKPSYYTGRVASSTNYIPRTSRM